MGRRKAARNEIADYLKESFSGTAALWGLFYILNNHTNNQVPYDLAPAVAFSWSAATRWLPVQQTARGINTARSSVLVNGEKMMLSSVQTIFGKSEPRQEKKQTGFRIRYRESKTVSTIPSEMLMAYLTEGYLRQMSDSPYPFSLNSFVKNKEGKNSSLPRRPKMIECCYTIVGRCGQFDSFGQGASSRLLTRPQWAIRNISSIWEPPGN